MPITATTITEKTATITMSTIMRMTINCTGTTAMIMLRTITAPADNNLRAAYLHVVADALTSVLAIAALVLGSLYGWNWLDPTMGIVGGLVIARWSWGLIGDTGAVLLDYIPEDEGLPEEIRDALETRGDRITDLHVWQLGPGHHGAIVSILSQQPQQVGAYREKLLHIHELSHVTIEVERAASA